MTYKLGKGYDELAVGEKASFTKTVTETDVTLFVGITGDTNPVHVNEVYVAEGNCVMRPPRKEA